MYDGDSFFTLSGLGQAGLLALSLSLATLTAWGLWWIAQGRALVWRLCLALALFWGFVWLSPQVYYQYYRLIFDGLPAQWVIGWPPGLAHYLALLSFTSDSNLSNHSQGALGWLLAALATLRGRRAVA